MYRYYVIACDAENEYDDSVTHVALALRPSLVWRLTWYSLLARLLEKLVGWWNFYHLEVSLRIGLTWLNLNPIDADFPDEWEEGAVVETIDPALVARERTEGDSVRLCGRSLWVSTWHHYSGDMYDSREIILRDLLAAVRWSDVVAEWRERFGIGKGAQPCAIQPR